MKIKTKIFITLALLIVSFSAFILVSSAEESAATVTVTDAESLNTAISDSNVTYIKLGADFTVDEPIIVSRDGITIDLNGHTVTAYQSADYTILFELQLENIKFTVTGSGTFNTSRTLFYTNKAKNAQIALSATGVGITVTSPDTFKYPYFKVGVSEYNTATLMVSGALNIFHSYGINTFDINVSSTLNITNAIINDSLHPDISDDITFDTFNIYKKSILNISDSIITNKCGSMFNIRSGLNTALPTISVENSSFYALDGCILTSSGTYSKLTLQNSHLEYTNCAFKASSTLNNAYCLNLDMTNTQSTFCGTASDETALLYGKITAVIEGGFHNLNGASLAIGTVAYASNNGILIKKGTAIGCEFSSNENVMVENEGAEIAKWYDSDTNDNLIAMGYYDSAQEAVLDASVLPIVDIDDRHYNLKYTSWNSTYNDVDNSYSFTPDENTMLPIADIRGIKYNLSTYTNFNMNIYVPSDIDMIGGYWDANCTYPLNSTSHKIEEEDYLKYSFEFGASDMDRIVMYVKYNAEYKESVYTLIQKIEVSVIDYTESILSGSEFSDIEKQLAADMLRYCNETIKIADGSYNFTASEILETYQEHLTDINSIQIENTDTDCKSLSYYIKEAMLVFNSYEPKFAFRYTENVTSPSASESDNGIWLNIAYNSVDGTQKTAKTELNTDNSLFFAFGISAYDIDEVLTIRVCTSGEDKPLAEGTFSLSTYILTLESTAIDMTFAKVLYAYSLSAEIYKKSL